MTATTESGPRWRAAVAEFNAGNYYEAHELWEGLWLDAVGDEKLLMQGLAQVAAGYAKLEVGQVNGARKLFERGLMRLHSTADGERLADLLAVIEEGLERLRALPFGAGADLTAVPKPRL